jgi:RHS repeat-associated protein
MNRIIRYLRLDDLLADDDELFDGSKFDLATGLQDNRHRHYDPTPGKWMSDEPLGYNADDVNVTPYVDRPPPPQQPRRPFCEQVHQRR